MAKYGNQTINWFEGVINKMGGIKKAEAFLRGEFELVSAKDSTQKLESEIDTLIKVDRSVRVQFPSNVKLHFPELECEGSQEYSMADLTFWTNPEGNFCVDFNKLYRYLKNENMIRRCLGFDDALAIQKKGIKPFRTVFGNKTIICWRSVATLGWWVSSDKVPCISGVGGSVEIEWVYLNRSVSEEYVTALFPE